jgi:hypothetical protein
LREDFAASDPVLKKLQFIEGFDLVSREEPRRKARLLTFDRAELELKRFFALPLLFPEDAARLAPSLRLDALWHAFILNTPRYRAFCEGAYGQYLDHVPGPSRRETKKRVREGPMKLTLDCLARAFGEPDKRFWGGLVFCGPCLFFASPTKASAARGRT